MKNVAKKKAVYSLTPESATLLAHHLTTNAIQAKASTGNVSISFDNDTQWANGTYGKPCWTEVYQTQDRATLVNKIGAPGGTLPEQGMPVPQRE